MDVRFCKRAFGRKSLIDGIYKVWSFWSDAQMGLGVVASMLSERWTSLKDGCTEHRLLRASTVAT